MACKGAFGLASARGWSRVADLLEPSPSDGQGSAL